MQYLIQMKLTPKQKRIQTHQQSSQRPKTPVLYDLIEYPADSICQALTFSLIRPPRFVYNPHLLTPNIRNSTRFTAKTVNIGFDLTIYQQTSMRYVVLYLHGNGGSRLEGVTMLPHMPDRVGLACFDFNGCGNRFEAEYITLGQKESSQVDIAVKYLKNEGYTVVCWGRSMGAVSVLRSTECEIIIADSAYSNLTKLCKEFTLKSVPALCCCCFHMLFPCVLSCIKCRVESQSGLDIGLMDVKKHLENISKEKHNKQICFLHGTDDTLISSVHAKKLYHAFKGRKQLIQFSGGHNSIRPPEVIAQCFEFIQKGLNDRWTQEIGFSSKNDRPSRVTEIINTKKDRTTHFDSQSKMNPKMMIQEENDVQISGKSLNYSGGLEIELIINYPHQEPQYSSDRKATVYESVEPNIGMKQSQSSIQQKVMLKENKVQVESRGN